MKYSLALIALAATSAAAFAPSATGVREHVCHPTKREGKPISPPPVSDYIGALGAQVPMRKILDIHFAAQCVGSI